jgi:excisionase family DNA binding protein
MSTDTFTSTMGVNTTSVYPTSASSPWLTVKEAAERARCGVKLIYREVEAKRLRAARVGGRRELRILPEWIDQWLLAQTTIHSA